MIKNVVKGGETTERRESAAFRSAATMHLPVEARDYLFVEYLSDHEIVLTLHSPQATVEHSFCAGDIQDLIAVVGGDRTINAAHPRKRRHAAYSTLQSEAEPDPTGLGACNALVTRAPGEKRTPSVRVVLTPADQRMLGEFLELTRSWMTQRLVESTIL